MPGFATFAAEVRALAPDVSLVPMIMPLVDAERAWAERSGEALASVRSGD